MGMRQSKRKVNKDKGFTLIEITIVLVLLCTIATVVSMRVWQSGTLGTEPLLVETDGLKASLRYAQIQSLNENDSANWGINFAHDGTSYTLYKNGSAATNRDGAPIMIPVKNRGRNPNDPFYDPDTGSCPRNCHKMNRNVKIESGSEGWAIGTTLTFDKWGTPLDSTNVPLQRNVVIILSQGTVTSQITVTKNTGFIP
jgi:prepilin-type N-terminal cleavage/methylation domain-containing protein